MEINKQFIYHDRSFDRCGKGRDVTFVANLDENNILRVSAAICSPQDIFIKKVGIKLAKEKFERGEFLVKEKLIEGAELTRAELIHLLENIGLNLRLYGPNSNKFTLKQRVDLRIVWN